MKTFAATLLIASSAAQSTTVGNIFSGLIKDYLASDWLVHEFSAVKGVADTDPSLDGSVQWDTTSLGLNFLTMSLALTAPVATFGAGTNQMVWFQVEEPIIPAAARLL